MPQQTPKDVLRAILADPTNLESVSALMAPDATYVSLNFSNPALKRVMPWAGTAIGPAAVVQTFVDVGRYWAKEAFEEIALFGDDRYAALFGRMTYRSVVLGKQVTSPFAVYVEVVDGLCRHMQFMEDTLATTESFRSAGAWTIRSDPAGAEITL
ncbi:nuclear transport factor 2 family protein [Lichenihabitans sp. Uapishka_5]|uniref:nuclear transport factor 2 family protein n=1 Tax=Lichenihabitans sp. Uapishka_5 TaxID=3037302 RepID=UPI0029E82766|nr:nuclear transport factor 2 family protein [Lichenihabitans sp. Uapishka_5]MDX7953588.1 nuclear transport factor 2 family protein [Lichenihabitans sp. Uapishka_5]